MKLATEFLNGMPAMVTAAIASSLLTFLALALTGWISSPEAGWTSPMEVIVILSVVLIWGPAFALIPTAVLGVLLERPLARRLIEQRHGGFVAHLLAITLASLTLWLLLRIVVVLSGPQTEIIDPLSLFVFLVVGVSSALCWWLLVIIPGRRINAREG